MRRVSIHHQKYFAGPALKENLQKDNEELRVELAGIGCRPKFPTRIDRTDDTEALPLTGGLNHRCLALQSVGAPQRGIGLKPGFVLKENLGPEPFGPLFELRVSLLDPVLDGHWVALIGPAQWLLRGDVQAGQQPPHSRQP